MVRIPDWLEARVRIPESNLQLLISMLDLRAPSHEFESKKSQYCMVAGRASDLNFAPELQQSLPVNQGENSTTPQRD